MDNFNSISEQHELLNNNYDHEPQPAHHEEYGGDDDNDNNTKPPITIQQNSNKIMQSVNTLLANSGLMRCLDREIDSADNDVKNIPKVINAYASSRDSFLTCDDSDFVGLPDTDYGDEEEEQQEQPQQPEEEPSSPVEKSGAGSSTSQTEDHSVSVSQSLLESNYGQVFDTVLRLRSEADSTYVSALKERKRRARRRRHSLQDRRKKGVSSGSSISEYSLGKSLTSLFSSVYPSRNRQEKINEEVKRDSFEEEDEELEHTTALQAARAKRKDAYGAAFAVAVGDTGVNFRDFLIKRLSIISSQDNSETSSLQSKDRDRDKSKTEDGSLSDQGSEKSPLDVVDLPQVRYNLGKSDNLADSHVSNMEISEDSLMTIDYDDSDAAQEDEFWSRAEKCEVEEDEQADNIEDVNMTYDVELSSPLNSAGVSIASTEGMQETSSDAQQEPTHENFEISSDDEDNEIEDFEQSHKSGFGGGPVENKSNFNGDGGANYTGDMGNTGVYECQSITSEDFRQVTNENVAPAECQSITSEEYNDFVNEQLTKAALHKSQELDYEQEHFDTGSYDASDEKFDRNDSLNDTPILKVNSDDVLQEVQPSVDPQNSFEDVQEINDKDEYDERRRSAISLKLEDLDLNKEKSLQSVQLDDANLETKCERLSNCRPQPLRGDSLVDLMKDMEASDKQTNEYLGASLVSLEIDDSGREDQLKYFQREDVLETLQETEPHVPYVRHSFQQSTLGCSMSSIDSNMRNSLSLTEEAFNELERSKVILEFDEEAVKNSGDMKHYLDQSPTAESSSLKVKVKCFDDDDEHEDGSETADHVHELRTNKLSERSESNLKQFEKDVPTNAAAVHGSMSRNSWDGTNPRNLMESGNRPQLFTGTSSRSLMDVSNAHLMEYLEGLCLDENDDETSETETENNTSLDDGESPDTHLHEAEEMQVRIEDLNDHDKNLLMYDDIDNDSTSTSNEDEHQLSEAACTDHEGSENNQNFLFGLFQRQTEKQSEEPLNKGGRTSIAHIHMGPKSNTFPPRDLQGNRKHSLPNLGMNNKAPILFNLHHSYSNVHNGMENDFSNFKHQSRTEITDVKSEVTTAREEFVEDSLFLGWPQQQNTRK